MFRNPLDESRHMGNYDIAQLLLLSEFKGNIGDRLKERASSLNRERGIIENVTKELTRIGEQSSAIFMKIMMEIITSSMQNKCCYDDIMLSLCHKYIGADEFEESELFKAITKASNDTIQNGNKKDWYWFKEILLKSNVKSMCFCANTRIITKLRCV